MARGLVPWLSCIRLAELPQFGSFLPVAAERKYLEEALVVVVGM